MRPLAEWPPGERRAVRGVFTDIDDTLTRDGAIEPESLAALHALRDAGLPVIAITGRPMGWSLPFASAWPVAAIVPENGALALLPDGRRWFVQDEATRERNARRLAQVAQRVLDEVPGACLASDSPGRLTDIAIDHSEFHPLPPQRIEQVVALMRAEGLTATVSSIHINGWIGEHDKWTGAVWIARELLGIDLPAELDRWVYVGDSTNDQVMFERFVHSVGVANIARFLPTLRHLPKYVCTRERGAGFAQVAAALLTPRG
ncbi:HAD-IIB family hydrolase [Aquabacterium sp. A7-Y]|uniref:HAD family hydrolase n=1 Tax=Aquabacterium sp. A7-Y TaxID=1349605 RepID=UPI00223CCA38|nr:HAD-IIB family hydrolase [Aquabacterium sp. A7-Y]MCW7539075.1 HAD-IIB family hydrolase [Aquabacterium sp. A7-Y]